MNAKTYYVGIDVSDKTFDITVITEPDSIVASPAASPGDETVLCTEKAEGSRAR